jgi:hypothetical protein
MDLCPASVLYREARDLIRLCFISVQVLHILRSSNKCAHELARLSFDLEPDQPHVWFDPLSSFVNGSVVRNYRTLINKDRGVMFRKKKKLRSSSQTRARLLNPGKQAKASAE